MQLAAPWDCMGSKPILCLSQEGANAEAHPDLWLRSPTTRPVLSWAPQCLLLMCLTCPSADAPCMLVRQVASPKNCRWKPKALEDKDVIETIVLPTAGVSCNTRQGSAGQAPHLHRSIIASTSDCSTCPVSTRQLRVLGPIHTGQLILGLYDNPCFS